VSARAPRAAGVRVGIMFAREGVQRDFAIPLAAVSVEAGE
jgi:hypothetical protein